MDNKFFVSVFLIFTLFIVYIGGVSAADNVSSNQTNLDTGSVVSNPQVVDSDDNVVYQENSISGDNQILGDSNDGIVINSSTDLERVFNDSTVNNTIIYLNNQSIILKYNGSSFRLDNRNLTFCGGSTLDDNLESSIEIVNASYPYIGGTNSKLTFLRINFLNGTYLSFGDYSSSNGCEINLKDVKLPRILLRKSIGTFENCVFENTVNDKGFITAEISNLTVKNCSFLTHGRIFLDSSNISIYNSSFQDINTSHAYSSGSVSYDLFEARYNNNIIIDNCSFNNITNEERYAVFDIFSGNNNAVFINNSRFNNTGRTIYSGWDYYNDGYTNFVVSNSIFSNNNASSIYLDGLTVQMNITNTTFLNNSAKSGPAIYSHAGNISVNNCNFINNSAVYGGAVYLVKLYDDSDNLYCTNININGSNFINNSAVYGGAMTISANETNITNSLFENNKAEICGGAIIIGNGTNTRLLNNTFVNNEGSSYGDDIYYYYGNLTLDNNGEIDIYNNSNDTSILDSIIREVNYSIPYYQRVCYFICNNTTVCFCLELNEYFGDLALHSYFRNTNIAINSITHEYVGNYIKYLLYNYYGKISNDLLVKLIWTFTDKEYYNPNYLSNVNLSDFDTDVKYYSHAGAGGSPSEGILGLDLDGSDLDVYIAVFNDTYNSVNNGVIIPDHGATKINDDGTVSVYDFSTLLAPECQNLIMFNVNNTTDYTPGISIIKITNNRTVYRGDDTSFDIVVTNNGTVMLSNVTVTEDSYDDLTYTGRWSPLVGNWTYNYVDGKHTWTLTGYLAVNQTASFNVVFSTGNSTLGNKTNIVSVTTNENVTGNASNVTEVIENKTPSNNTPNTPENNTPNKPTPVDNKTVENNNTPKADIKTTEATGYPFIPLIIALIGIMGTGFRKK